MNSLDGYRDMLFIYNGRKTPTSKTVALLTQSSRADSKQGIQNTYKRLRQ